MPHILNYTQAALEQVLENMGHARFRAKQVHQAIYRENGGHMDFMSMQTLPKTLREDLRAHFDTSLPSIEHCSESPCGTIKWLFSMDGKNAVETVYIPETNRGTLCISSQVGCALACQFCATGLAGFLRNLTTAEIIAQVWYARHLLQQRTGKQKPITNIVFMGMGEPLLNEHNVFDSTDILLSDLGFGFSKYRVTISTSGIVPAIDRLTDRTEAALAVSLHSAIETTRDTLVPINKKYPLAALMQSLDRYTLAKKRSITYEYVMLAGKNDSDEHAHALGKLLKNRKAKINLIPYNRIESLDLDCSSDEVISRFQRILQHHGIVTTVRKTRGSRIDAACGQLFGKVTERKKTISHNQYQKQRALS